MWLHKTKKNMRIQINKELLPKVRRAILEKLMEMFPQDVEFKFKTIEHIQKNTGIVTSTENQIIVNISNNETVYSEKQFLKQTEIIKIFKFDSTDTSRMIKNLNKFQKNFESFNLVDLTNLIIKAKVFCPNAPSNDF